MYLRLEAYKNIAARDATRREGTHAPCSAYVQASCLKKGASQALLPREIYSDRGICAICFVPLVCFDKVILGKTFKKSTENWIVL